MAGFAQGTIGFSFYGQDFGFEIYNGNSYVAVNTPYTYTTYVNSTPYYYFDHPYRVYAYGNYDYFQPGWYSFATSTLAIAPDVIVSNYAVAPDILTYGYYQFAPSDYLYYSYIPQNYYYYGSSWNYYPSWVYTYGPSYYGNYFYPPADNTLTGQTYQPAQEAYCSQINFTIGPLNVSEGSKTHGVLYVNNNSDKYLDVHDVSITTDSQDVEIANVKYENQILDGSISAVRFDAVATDNLSSQNVTATVTLSGTFRDGTYCNSGDISQDFTISVYGKTKKNDVADIYAASQTSAPQSMGSAAYFRENKYNDDEFANLSENSYDNLYNSNTSKQNTSGQTANFQSNVEVAKTPYGKGQQVAQNCEGLFFDTENLSVKSGETKTSYFQVKNYADEDFFIDRLEVKDYSPDFTLEASNDSKTVFAGQSRSVKLKVNAGETKKTATGSGYINIKGHYGSGLECAKSSKPLFVTVVGKDVSGQDVILTIASKAELKGNSGFVVFGLENNSDSAVRVEVSGKNVDVSDSQFTFNAKTKGERTIALNNLQGEGKIYYKVVSEGAVIAEKITRVVKIGEINVAGDATPAAAKDTNALTGQTVVAKEPKNALPDFNSLVAGFVGLSDSGLLLGGIVLAVIFAIALLLPKPENKVVIN